MINKLAKAQKSWIAKLILTLTALSFVSLFGVSEYINRARSNQTVIKVDNIEVSQAQFAHQTQKEIAEAKRLLGSEDEISEEMQAALIYEQIQKVVRNAVLDRTAQKYHLAFRPALLRSLIVNQPLFQDASGNFNRELFKRYLSENNITESEMLSGMRRDLTRRLLVELPVQGFAVPKPLTDALARVDNKRRTFKYLEITPEKITVDRKISQEEIEQYYEDFGSGFIEPERRDISVLYLNNEAIAAAFDISADEIKEFYNANINNYETPETRQILQMMFETKEKAETAYKALENGADFYEVAAQNAGQSKEETLLGYVSEDELIDEMAGDVFALSDGGYTQPVQVGAFWQIMKVDGIKKESKVPYDVASAEIKALLQDEKLYEQAYELAGKIEDKAAAGASLEDIAKEFSHPLSSVKGLGDDGTYTYAAPQIRNILKGQDLLETVFSYAMGEISQVIETDDGLVVVRTDNIVPEHQKAIGEVQEDIRKLWIQNEKTAIVQELLNDVMHDLENGDSISATGKRYGLEVYRSQPITRNETFAGLGYAQIREMFAEQLNTPRQFQMDDKHIIAVADNDYKNSVPLDEAEQNMIKFNARMMMLKDFASAMLASYAQDYKIRIQYKLLGIED